MKINDLVRESHSWNRTSRVRAITQENDRIHRINDYTHSTFVPTERSSISSANIEALLQPGKPHDDGCQTPITHGSEVILFADLSEIPTCNFVVSGDIEKQIIAEKN